MGPRTVAAVLVLAGALALPVPAAARPFPDVSVRNWAHDEIVHVVEQGYLGVDADGRFRPGATISRGAALRALWRAAGAPTGYGPHGRDQVAPAFDVVVRWAVAEGLEAATGPFGSGAAATRRDVLRWLWRADGAPVADALAGGLAAYPATSIRGAPTAAARWGAGEAVLDPARDREFRATDAVRRSELAAWLARWDRRPPAELVAWVLDTNLVEVRWRAPAARSASPLTVNLEAGLDDEPAVEALPAECEDGPWCAASFRVSRTGWIRVTLTVRGGPPVAPVAAEALVERLPAPVVTARRVVVDRLAPGPQTLTWTAPPGVGPAPLETDFVTVTPPGRLFPVDQRFPLAGTYEVPVLQRATDSARTWSIRYCRKPQGGPGLLDDVVCSPGAPVTFVPQGAVFTGEVGDAFRHERAVGDDLALTWAGPGDQWALVAPTLLDEPLVSATTGHTFTDLPEGVHDIGLVSCAGTCPADLTGLARDRVQVVVGLEASRPDWTRRAVGDDFVVEAVDTLVRPSTGSPLDVALDAEGTVWAVGEFGADLARLDEEGLTHVEAPYARVGGRAATPFANPFHDADSGPVCGGSPISALAERVLVTDDHVWFSQGGALFPLEVCGGRNHSRLVRVDADGSVCAVHVPGVNGQVVGLAHDPATDRVWFAEPGDTTDPAVGWFDEGAVACDNDLDYGDPAAVAAAAERNRCPEAGPTPGCIHRIRLGEWIAPAHLAVDPTTDSVWVTDFGGRTLARVPLDGAGPVERFPLPTPLVGGLFGGFTWQVRATADAVYLVEYLDNQLIRFDTTVPDRATACAVLVDGANPCMDELFLPLVADTLTAHSIALDPTTDRLWFTVADEPNGVEAVDQGYVGYVDLATWGPDEAPAGVVYDLAGLGPPPSRPHRAPRGIDVDPTTGTVAVAEMGSEILVLRPR